MDRLGWIPKQKYDEKIKAYNEMYRMTEEQRNQYLSILYQNQIFPCREKLDEVIGKSKAEIKVSKHTTKRIGKTWKYVKYSRPMHKYLEYDNEATEHKYKEYAKSLIGENEFYYAEQVVIKICSVFYISHRPWQRYNTDTNSHKISDVWESPAWLYENLIEKNGKADCDSWSILMNRIIHEALLLTFPEATDRLSVVLGWTPNREYHMFNLWEVHDHMYGYGYVPIESTYHSEHILYDITGRRWIHKLRYLLDKGFNDHEEWEWMGDELS